VRRFIADLTRAPERRDIAMFFVALFVAFGGLVTLGHVVSGINYIHDFARFHLYINPATLYYPTASQAVELTKSLVPRDKIAVVVGGSSVMWGAGQSDSELWTRRLQEDLGDRYSVVNLALPSGSPQEHGGVTAQYLFKNGYKVIYLADLGGSFGPPDGLFTPYVYWDGYYRGYLLPNDQAMPLIETLSKSRTTAPPLDELRTRAALDSVLRFTDFWNAFGYNVLFTTWNYLVYPPAGQFVSPRGQFTDPQGSYPPTARYSSPPLAQAMAIVRGYVYTQCPVGPSGPQGKDSADLYWDSWESSARVAFPAEFRRNMLMVRLFQARYYRDQLTDSERECYAAAFANMSNRLMTDGYNAAELGADWTAEDYVDVTHPSASGGDKMAEQLAGDVRRIAQDLGYAG
jgi:hypothetical protein